MLYSADKVVYLDWRRILEPLYPKLHRLSHVLDYIIQAATLFE